MTMTTMLTATSILDSLSSYTWCGRYYCTADAGLSHDETAILRPIDGVFT
jgi:hypothetical protein